MFLLRFQRVSGHLPTYFSNCLEISLIIKECLEEILMKKLAIVLKIEKITLAKGKITK
jgi:hypothetical protein